MKHVPVFAFCIRDLPRVTEYPIAPTRMEELRRIAKPAARAQSLAGELLLCWAVRRLRPQHVPIPPVRSYLPQGKPYFSENPEFCFSISHAGQWAVLAVSDAPIGIDVECAGPNRPRLVARFFHPQEIAYFQSLPPQNQADAFYRLWVLKEGAVKAVGTGMHRPFSGFAVSLEPLRVQGFASQLSPFLVDFDPDYRLGGCVQTDCPVCPQLRVLSPQELIE